MAQNVTVKVLGGDTKVIEAQTVREAKQKLGVPSHTASVNGQPARDEDELAEYSFVTLAPAVKGGVGARV